MKFALTNLIEAALVNTREEVFTTDESDILFHVRKESEERNDLRVEELLVDLLEILLAKFKGIFVINREAIVSKQSGVAGRIEDAREVLGHDCAKLVHLGLVCLPMQCLGPGKTSLSTFAHWPPYFPRPCAVAPWPGSGPGPSPRGTARACQILPRRLGTSGQTQGTVSEPR